MIKAYEYNTAAIRALPMLNENNRTKPMLIKKLPVSPLRHERKRHQYRLL